MSNIDNNFQKNRIDLDNKQPAAVYDTKGAIVEVSPRFLSKIGFGGSEEELANSLPNVDSHFQIDKRRIHQSIKKGVSKYTYDLLLDDGSSELIDVQLKPYNLNGKTFIECILEPSKRNFFEQTQILLEKNELREAQEIAKTGHYVLDVETGLWTSSEILDRIFGIDKSYQRDVEGWLNIVSEDDRRAMQTYLQEEVLARGKNFDREYRITDQISKQTKWVHGRGNLSFDKDGNLTRMIGTIQDITEQQRTKEELEKLSFVASSIQEGISITDSEGKITWVNKAFEELTGYTFEEMVGEKPGELLQGEDTSSQTVEEIRKGLALKEPFSVDILNYHKSGTPYWCQLRINPNKNSDGIITSYIGTQSDITIKQHAEELLIRSEDQLSRLVNSIPGAVMKYRIHDNGTDELVYLSSGVSEIYEIEPFEALTDISIMWNRVLEQDAIPLRESIMRSSAGMSTWDHTWQIKTPSGKLKWLNGRGNPYRDNRNSITWDMIISDVTDFHLSQQELSRSKDKYKSLLDTVNGVVYECDPKTLAIHFASKKSLTLFGLDVSLWSKSTFWKDHIHADDFDRFMEETESRTKRGKGFSIDFRLRIQNGSYKWVRNIVTLKTEEGDEVLLHGLIIDISNEKEVELKLHKSEMLFKSFSDQIPSIVYLKDGDKNYVFANRYKKNLHGDDLSLYNKLVVKRQLDQSTPSDLEEMDDWVLAQNKAKTTYNLTYDNVKGRVFNELRFPINLPDGTRLIGGLSIDVTDLHELQHEIKLEKNRAENIIKGTNAGTWIFHPKTDALEVNDRALELLGHSGDTDNCLTGRTWRAYIHPDDLENLQQLFESASQEKNKVVEYQIRTKNASADWTWLQVRGSSMKRNFDNNEILVTGTILDITDQKRIAIKLEEERVFAQNIITSTDAGTWELDIEKGIVRINQRWASIIGYTIEELGQVTLDRFRSLIHPDDIALMADSYEKHITGINPFHELEFRMKHKKGGFVWIYSKGKVWKFSSTGEPIKLSGTHLDIDIKKKSEIEIKAQERNISNIIEATRAGTWSIDLQSKEMEINDRYTEMFGYSKEEFEPRSFGKLEELIHPKDLPTVKNRIQQHIDGTTDFYESEFRVKHKRGHWVWVLDRGKVIDRDDSGSPIKVYGTQLDITERKKYQFELFDNQEKYKYLAENTSDIVTLMDKNLDFLYVSPSASKVLGYEIEDYNTLELGSLVYYKDYRELNTLLQEMITQPDKNSLTWEYRMIVKDKKIIWVNTRFKATRDASGKLVNILTSSNDITIRKTAETLLQETNKKLELAVKTANLGIWATSRYNDQIDWNEEMCSIFNLTEGCDQKDWLTVIAAEDKINLLKNLSMLNLGRTIEGVRFKIRNLDGSYKHALASGFAIKNKDGKVESLIGSILDISKLAKQEEDLKKALTEKNTLFKELNHRIKNNLQLVTSLIHLESRKLKNEHVDSFVKVTNARLLSMAQIHEQLLRIQKTDQLDISPYVDKMMDQLVNLFKKENTEYHLNVNVPSTLIKVDQALALGLILNEVVTNTLKYAYPNQESGVINVSLESKDDSHIFMISDEGVGLDPNENHSEKSSLGVNLIHALVDQLDGSLKVDSESGMAYRITFPSTFIE